MTLAFSVKDKIQTQKGSNKRLSILPRTHSVPVFGEIPFVKPQDDKRLKTMENKREKTKKTSLLLVDFLSRLNKRQKHTQNKIRFYSFFLSFFFKNIFIF